MEAIKSFISLEDKVSVLYSNYSLDIPHDYDIDYIERLKKEVYFFNTDTIREELKEGYPSQEQLGRRLEFAESDLWGYLEYFPVENEVCGKSRCKEYFIKKLGSKEGAEYSFHFCSMLRYFNEKIREIRSLMEFTKIWNEHRGEKEDVSGVDKYSQNGKQIITPKDSVRMIPKEFDTNEAKRLFKRAIDSGFMDESYKFIGTWYQAAYFAERAAEFLNLKHKWKPFKELWNHKNLAQTRRESKERFGYVEKQDDIDAIFN